MFRALSKADYSVSSSRKWFKLRSDLRAVLTGFPARLQIATLWEQWFTSSWGHKTAPDTIHAQSTRTERIGQFKPETVTGKTSRRLSDAQSTPTVKMRPTA
jgi:hypothetical protein